MSFSYQQFNEKRSIEFAVIFQLISVRTLQINCQLISIFKKTNVKVFVARQNSGWFLAVRRNYKTLSSFFNAIDTSGKHKCIYDYPYTIVDRPFRQTFTLFIPYFIPLNYHSIRAIFFRHMCECVCFCAWWKFFLGTGFAEETGTPKHTNGKKLHDVSLHENYSWFLKKSRKSKKLSRNMGQNEIDASLWKFEFLLTTILLGKTRNEFKNRWKILSKFILRIKSSKSFLREFGVSVSELRRLFSF